MIHNSKFRLQDKDGKAIPPAELFAFFATIKNADGTIVGADPLAKVPQKGLKDVPLEGYFLGEFREAREVAEANKKQIEPSYPDKTITVRAVPMEKVGPIMQTQMKGLMADSRMQELVAYTLATDLANYKAKEKLEINPNIPLITGQLIVEARQLVAQKLREAADKAIGTPAAEGAGLVGPDGHAISSESLKTGEPCGNDCADCSCDQAAEGEDASCDQPKEVLSDEAIAQSFEPGQVIPIDEAHYLEIQ